MVQLNQKNAECRCLQVLSGLAQKPVWLLTGVMRLPGD